MNVIEPFDEKMVLTDPPSVSVSIEGGQQTPKLVSPSTIQRYNMNKNQLHIIEQDVNRQRDLALNVDPALRYLSQRNSA